MPIVQKKSAADAFLDAPDGSPAPTPTPAPLSPAPRSSADAFLDAPDTRAGIVAGNKPGIVGNTIGNWWDQANPMGIAKSMADFVPREPKDLMVARPFRNMAEAAGRLISSGVERLGAGEIGQGIRGIASGLVPGIGPSLDKAGAQAYQGDYSGALGTTLGIATNLFGPKILNESGAGAGIRSGLQSTANRIYRIGAPGMTPELAEFGTKRGVPFTGSGIQKIGGILDESGQAIGGPIRSAPQTRTISPGPVVTGLDDLKQKYLKSEAPPIEVEKQRFLDEIRTQPGAAVPNMTPEEAFDLKVKYQNRASREKATAYDRGFTENSPEIASVQTVPSRLGEQLVAQFPEIKSQNAIYGLASELQPVVEHIVDLASRKNILPTLTTLGGSAVAGMATGQTTAGLAAGVAMELMRNPAARSRIAIALSKASGVPLPEAMARVAGYLNAAAAGGEDRGSQVAP